MVKKIVKGKQIFARKAQPATKADKSLKQISRGYPKTKGHNK